MFANIVNFFFAKESIWERKVIFNNT